MSLAKSLRDQFPKTHVCPHSFEIAEWMTTVPDGLSETYVRSQILSLSIDEWINPFTVLRQLQHGLSEEDAKRYWPLFQAALDSLDKTLEIEQAWPMEKLLEYGYLPYSAKEMLTYVETRVKTRKV